MHVSEHQRLLRKARESFTIHHNQKELSVRIKMDTTVPDTPVYKALRTNKTFMSICHITPSPGTGGMRLEQTSMVPGLCLPQQQPYHKTSSVNCTSFSRTQLDFSQSQTPPPVTPCPQCGREKLSSMGGGKQ